MNPSAYHEELRKAVARLIKPQWEGEGKNEKELLEA